MEKSKVLIIGATGELGFLLAKSSLDFCHPTFALVRESAFSDPIKAQRIQFLTDSGATILKGSLQDEASLVEAVKQVDVVISAVSTEQIHNQKLLIQVIKQVGTIKRFIPSEFESDCDKVRLSVLDAGYNFYKPKVEIRRLIEAEGIPYTIISCNFFMSFLVPSLVQPGLKVPPRDKVTIFGDGNTRGVFVKEKDIATFTINAVDDPRTSCKILYLRPPGNIYSINELVDLWETKIGKKLEKSYVSEEELLIDLKGITYPENFEKMFIYSAFVLGDHTYFDINPRFSVEGSELYPHVKYTTISELLDTLV